MLLKVKSKKLKVKSLRLKVGNKILLSFVLCLSPIFVDAQCAMCRAALESEEGGAQAEAINDGIVYLMVIPYILVAVAAYFIYKLKFSKKEN